MKFYQCITDFIFVEDEPQPADIIFVPGGSYPEAALHAAELYHRGFAPYILPSGKYGKLTGHFVTPEPPQVKSQAVCSDAGKPEERIVYSDVRQPEEWIVYSDVRQPEERTAYSDAKQREEQTAYSDAKQREKRTWETECDYLCAVLTEAGVPEHALIREDQATFTYENAIYSRKRTEELGLTVRRALLCCQAFHARRSLMYYQEQFPDTEFLVCPVVTRGISRDSWHCSREGIDVVLGEVERCGEQFHEILYSYITQAANGNTR